MWEWHYPFSAPLVSTNNRDQPTLRGSVLSWFSSHLREKYQPFQIPGDPKVTDSGPWDFLSHLQIYG